MNPKPKHKRKKKTNPEPSKTRGMTRWNHARLAYIHERIASGSYPTVKKLMEELEVSCRETILRDIRSLKLHHNTPVKVSRRDGQNGYYYDGPVGQKLGRTFSEDEVTALFIADRVLGTMPVKERQKRLGLGFEKISQLLDARTSKLLNELQGTVHFRPFAPEQIDVETFLTLAEAVRKGRVVRFCYRKIESPAPELKRVQPFCFTCSFNSWYMIGLDVEKQEERTYLLSRLSAPMVTSETFTRPISFSVEGYLKGAFVIHKGNGKESYDVVVEFDAWSSHYIRNRRFTSNQLMEELPNGGVRLSMRLGSLDEVDAWVMYWRSHATVIGPPALRERMRKYGEELVRRYAE